MWEKRGRKPWQLSWWNLCLSLSLESFSLTIFRSTNLRMLPKSCRKIISRKGWHLIYFLHPTLSCCGFGCKTTSLKPREVSSAPGDCVQTIEHVWRKGLFFGSLNTCSCQLLSSYGQMQTLCCSWLASGFRNIWNCSRKAKEVSKHFLKVPLIFCAADGL